MAYQKFCYWTDFRGLKRAIEIFEKKGIHPIDETRIPCRVLKAPIEIGYLAPQPGRLFVNEGPHGIENRTRRVSFLQSAIRPVIMQILEIPLSSQNRILTLIDFHLLMRFRNWSNPKNFRKGNLRLGKTLNPLKRIFIKRGLNVTDQMNLLVLRRSLPTIQQIMRIF